MSVGAANFWQMSKLFVRHLREALQQRFNGLIDLADVASAPEPQQESAFLTRALAAFALQRVCGVDEKTAAAAVVDGSGDNGLDAILVDASNVVVLVQSKWDSNGTGSIGLGESRNFIQALKDITDEHWDRFNAKFQPHVPLVEEALADPEVTFVMVVATSGSDEFAGPIHAAFDDMERELNDTQPLVAVERLGLRDLHAAIVADLSAQRIDLDVAVENWGIVTDPFEAYYGTVSASAIAGWYAKHGDKLFEQNIRKPLGNTSVNQALAQTLELQADHFWYFNNGITALCESVKRRAKGAGTRNHGEFALSGVSVVNGAQTVAAISRAARAGQLSEDRSPQVWLRFISLEGCPPEFASQVTRATNTQNAVERSDFVALDRQQDRLRTELLLSLQKTYSIKRGEAVPPPEHGCTVTEATVALACAQSETSLAVIAKSAVGRLWDSIDRPPYKTLFNPGTGAYRLWRCVQTMRAVDAQLETRRRELEGRAKSTAVQGNRIALHLVFGELDMGRVDDPEFDWEAHAADVPGRTDAILSLMIDKVQKLYASNYITSLFKNAGRCEKLVAAVRTERSASAPAP